jgi:hypothetical protein
MGSTLASTLPWVSTTPLGSPVVPEVKRISSGVSRLFGGQRAGPILKSKLRAVCWQLPQQQRIADGQLGPHVCRDAQGKFRRSIGVQRHGQHAAQDAAMESGNPLRAVFSPEQNPVARADAALGQQGGKTPREARNFAVTGGAPPVAPEADDRNLAVETPKVVEK